MASDTEITFYGLGHLAGETVQAFVVGLDCGDYVVSASGTVTVPFGSDDHGEMTPALLVSLDGYPVDQAASVSLIYNDDPVVVSVPVVIGKKFTSEGQGLRPMLATDLGIRTNGLGKVRRSHEFAALLHNTVKISFGTSFSNLDQAKLTTTDGETAYSQASVYTGVYRGVLTDQYGYDSMVCWKVDRPCPATVCAVSAFIVSED